MQKQRIFPNVEFINETKKYAASEMLYKIKIIDIRDICVIVSILTSMLILITTLLNLIINRIDTNYQY